MISFRDLKSSDIFLLLTSSITSPSFKPALKAGLFGSIPLMIGFATLNQNCSYKYQKLKREKRKFAAGPAKRIVCLCAIDFL